MLSLALILLVVAVIAGILGFGIANAVTHIAKFLFCVIVFLILIFFLYMFMSYHPNTTAAIQEKVVAFVNLL